MKRQTKAAVALAAALLILPLLRQAEAATPLAVLLTCRGDVMIVKQDGKTVRATFGSHLLEGDKVVTGASSQAEILFQNDNLIQVGSNSNMKMKGGFGGGNMAAQPAGEKSFQTVQNFLKLESDEGTTRLARLRSGNKKSSLRAVTPRDTKIIEPTPTFRWVGPENEELRLTLYSDEGEHWAADVTGKTEILYPGDAPELVAGVSYSWVLETTDPLRHPPLQTENVFFEVLDAEAIRSLKGALDEIQVDAAENASAYHLLRASVLFEYGAVESAIEETQAALEHDGDNSTLHTILARLLAEVGRTEDAMGLINRD